jgi:hypothetical protein
VNEQRREMAHAQQRSAGIAECNRWNSKAFALQNRNSHPTRRSNSRRAAAMHEGQSLPALWKFGRLARN